MPYLFELILKKGIREKEFRDVDTKILDVDGISKKKLVLSELIDQKTSISCKLGKLIYNILHDISNGTYFIFSYYIKHGTQVLAQALFANGIP